MASITVHGEVPTRTNCVVTSLLELMESVMIGSDRSVALTVDQIRLGSLLSFLVDITEQKPKSSALTAICNGSLVKHSNDESQTGKMNWIQKTWYALFALEPKHWAEEEKELEVPRHRWVTPEELGAYIGKRVEVPVVDDRFGGQTNIIGRVSSISYESFDNRTTLEIHGPHFVATVDVYPEMRVIVHL
jgi:hypothetical protein